ncbi:MAG: glycosyltransferase family 39 protein [Anaerolineae bacterium]|jgi:hypothetical protein
MKNCERMTEKKRAAERQRLWIKLGVLLIVFVAYSLQTGTLTLQSMWFDEVMSLHFTRGSLAGTVHRIVQPQHNGPLFYLLLFGWRHVVGDSDFAIRFLSVIFAVLTMPLLFQWVRRLLTDQAAATSVWLFAFSPFTLWFAQEARMYALHMLVAVASSLALLEAFRKGRWWRWLIYASLVSTVLYSHLFGAFLVASQAAMAIALGWRRRRRLLPYVTAMSLLGVAHLPLIRVAWRVVKNYNPNDVWRGFVPLGILVRDAVGKYFYRIPASQVSWPAFLLPVGLILVGSLALLLRRRTERWVVLFHAFVPVLIFYAVSFRAPVYAAKYLSAIVPALFVLVACGVEALSHLWRPVGIAILVLGTLMLNGVARDLTDPMVHRPDWRFAADYVENHEGPNDLVVISAYYMSYAFERYYHGESDVTGFGEDPYDPWPFYQRKAEHYDHLWLVLNHDQVMAPGNKLREVANNAFPIMTMQFPNREITLVGYQARFTYPALPNEVRPLDMCFQNGICVVGYSLDATSLRATDHHSHPPSNWLHVVLYWRREAHADDLSFRPLVRLVDGSFGVWGGNLEADRRPDLFDRYPPAEWPSDGVIETHFDLNLNPVTPPGTYHLEVSLAVEGDENRRVLLADPSPEQPADRFVFEAVQIQPGR